MSAWRRGALRGAECRELSIGQVLDVWPLGDGRWKWQAFGETGLGRTCQEARFEAEAHARMVLRRALEDLEGQSTR